MPTELISGQDGAYLAQLLVDRDYPVYGAYRRTSSTNFWRIAELGVLEHPNLRLVEYDLTDFGSALRLLETTDADEIYNLAAQSFVSVSFDQRSPPPRSPGSVRLTCWRRCARSIRLAGSTRRRRRRCSARWPPTTADW
jgi:GDP-D-mannose dehydratase